MKNLKLKVVHYLILATVMKLLKLATAGSFDTASKENQDEEEIDDPQNQYRVNETCLQSFVPDILLQ